MKIATKITLSFLVMVIIITTISATVFYVIVKNDILNEIDARMDSIVRSKAKHIETYLNMLKQTMAQLSKSVVLENLLKAKKEDPVSYKEAFETATKRLTRTEEAIPSIAEFMLLDKAGTVIASNNKNRVGEDMSADALFAGGQKKNYIKDVYYSNTWKKGLMAVSCPMLDSVTGEFLGVLAALVELKDLNSIVAENSGFGKTEEIFIINKYGYMITPSKFVSNSFLKQKVDTENSRSCVLHRDKGGICNIPHFIMICPDYRGVMIAGSNAYISEMQWCLLSKIDRDEALAPLKKITILFLLILLASPLASWLFGLAISSFITGPIHRLHRGAEIIGAGNLDYSVGTDSKDEIGQLSRAFDKMTKDLKGTTTSIDNLNKEIAMRKKVEDILKESERKIRAVLDQTFQFIGLLTNEGIMIEVNKAAINFAGIEESAVINKPFWETPWWTHSTEMQARLRDSIKKAARGEFVRFEATHVAKDGSLHYIDFSIKPVKDESGKVIFLIPEGRDITDYKNIENKLIQTAQEWETTFNSIPDLISIYDKNYKIVKVNKAFSNFFKMSPEELSGKFCYEVVHKSGEPFMGCPHKKTLETKKPQASEFFEPRLGIYVEASTSPLFDEDKNIVGTVHIIKNITERKKAEQSSRLLAAIVESSDDAIISKDLDNVITSWNKGAEEIYGYSEKEAVGKHISIVVPEEYSHEPYVILQKIKEGERIENFETIRQRRDGTRINTSLTFSPIMNSEGKVVGVSTIARDITERVKMTKALEEANEKLKELDKRKSTFVAHVSHEFKNPLAVIRESLSIVLEGITGEINSKQKEILESGKKNIERLIRLVTDLLDLSKIEAGKMELRREEIDIGPMTNYILSTYEKEFSKKELSLKKDIAGDIGFLWADKDKIEEVIVNLLSNAIKYTPAGGSVSVKLREDKSQIRFEISDTGPGIAKENIDKLFDKFERITVEKQEGTGLGLSISKDIIELHRGRIWVESEVGKGSAFIFTLPRDLRANVRI